MTPTNAVRPSGQDGPATALVPRSPGMDNWGAGDYDNPNLERTSSEFHRGFLGGLFDACSRVLSDADDETGFRMKHPDRPTLETVQRMLLRLGVRSSISPTVTCGDRGVPGDGGTTEAARRTTPAVFHELEIVDDGPARFAHLIGPSRSSRAPRSPPSPRSCVQSIEGMVGRETEPETEVVTYTKAEVERTAPAPGGVGMATIFRGRAVTLATPDPDPRRTNLPTTRRQPFIAHVTAIEPVGTEDVYDTRIPGINAFDANGLYVHNCGEQPLLPYESCNLGSINLTLIIRDGEVDWERLRRVTRTAVHFLDNVIDMNNFPLPEIERNTKANRKIGLGVMGWADLLIRLGIPYDSERALALAKEVMGFIDTESKVMSQELARVRGVFPNFIGSVYDRPGGKRLRNATTTTIAPTGTISMIADVSSGIEPLFALAFTKNVMDNDALLYVNGYFGEVMRGQKLYSDDLIKRIAEEGSLREIPDIPEAVARVFVTAHDITPVWHIRMQGAFQQFVDNAVSKTVNFPQTATRDDIAEVYLLAHELGCKGVTVYRDGSRTGQVVTIGKEQAGTGPGDGGSPGGEDTGVRKPRNRALFTRGGTLKMKTGCGNLYVTINEDDEGLFEVFASMGKAGGCASSQSEAISRLISLSLRSRIDSKSIVRQLKGIRCPNPTLWTGGPVYSCPDAIGKAMEKYLQTKEENAPPVETKTIESFANTATPQAGMGSPQTFSPTVKEGENTWMVGICPDCGSPLFYEEGCAVCRVCAFSKCG